MDNLDIKNLRLNRSYVLLLRGHFEDAKDDADTVLQSNPNDEKGLFRKARALYELRLFNESAKLFTELTKQFPLNKDAQQWSLRTRTRVLEGREGRYDYPTMAKTVKKSKPFLDCANYSEAVEIRPSLDKGRGLFTTRDVQAGDLLLVETAFCYASAESEGELHSDIRLLVDPIENRMTLGTQVDLIALIVNKLRKNPSLIPIVYEMYKGGYESTVTRMANSEAVIDT